MSSEVSQRARDAAANYMAVVSALKGEYDPAAMVFMDEAADDMPIVQAFAKFEREITPSEGQAVVPEDVRKLVIAARLVAYGDHSHEDDVRTLDRAVEAFADRIPWEDEPDDVTIPAPIVVPDALREAVEAAVNWLKSAPLESGVCCCGSPVESHGFGDGHSPVDDLAYSAHHLEERLVAALATKGTNAAVDSDGLRTKLMASLAKRSVPIMDPVWSAAFNAALDMVARDTGVAALSTQEATQ